MTAAPRLAFGGVCKVYRSARGCGVEALAAIDLEVRDGEFVCVIGRSGCGKTTLLRVAAGLEAPTSGSVLLDGKPVLGPSPAIGMVFQEDRLLPWRTVLGNVMLGLEIARVPAELRVPLAMRHLELVGLDDFAGTFPGDLSGGMRQRAAIARVLVNEPEVILMDEPFGALDALTRGQMQQELLRLRALAGATVVFVTHSVDEAVFLADRVVVLSPRPGRIRAEHRIEASHPRAAATPRLAALRSDILADLNAE